jgi:hypothetical protein
MSIALIKAMKEYRNLRKKEAGQYISLSKKSISGLDRLSTLSNYGTTAEAQRYTYQKLAEQAREMLKSCDLIKTVIDGYQKQVDDMYPKLRFRPTRKYYRAGEIELRFSNAHASLQKVLDTLEKLNDEKKSAKKAIDGDPVALQERDVSSTTNSKVNKLRDIEKDIASENDKKAKEEAAYIKEATKIVLEFQQLEEVRLNQIKQTLLKFIEAIHPSQYSTALLQNFEDLQSHVAHIQVSAKDVAQWAQLQGIQMPIPSETNVNNNITTVDNREN